MRSVLASDLKLQSIGTGGPRGPEKKSEIRIETPHSRQPLVKGERLIRCEVSAAMLMQGRSANSANF